jgi:hypothetical protein
LLPHPQVARISTDKEQGEESAPHFCSLGFGL